MLCVLSAGDNAKQTKKGRLNAVKVKNMKLDSTMRAEVLVKSTTKSKDGQTTYYKLTILQGAESGMLNCPEEVYNKVADRKEYIFNTQFNDEYKSFRITGVTEIPLKSAATTVPTGSTTK